VGISRDRKMRKHFFIFILILFILLIFHCKSDKAIWQGTIEDLDTVKVVTNPEEPLYGELVFDLKEDLSIGNESDGNFLFYKVRDVEIDTKNNIYILDAGNRRIQKFNDSGEYIQTVGQEGQGPGEFENPTDIYIDKENNLFVLDNKKVISFNSLGIYQGTIQTEVILSEFFITSQGTIVARINPAQERKKSIIHLDQNGKIINKYAEYPDVQPSIKKGQKRGSYVTFVAFHDYTPHPHFKFLEGDNFLYGYPLEYEINIVTYLGQPVLRIKKEENKKAISRKEKDKIMEELEASVSQSGRVWPEGALEEACRFPSYRPFYRDILIDEKKRIHVIRVMSVLNESNRIEIDIFNKSGYYLYRTELPFIPIIIQNGDMYELFSLEDTGEVRIRKYIIKNWDQIKEGI